MSPRKTIFEYLDHKEYLSDWIASQKNSGYGFRSRFARMMDCSRANVTKIMDGEVGLTLEQAERLSTYLKHTVTERRYFLNLAAYGRAGSPGLKSYLAAELARIRAQAAREAAGAGAEPARLICQVVLSDRNETPPRSPGARRTVSIGIEEKLLPEVEAIVRSAIHEVERLARNSASSSVRRPATAPAGESEPPFAFFGDFVEAPKPA